MHSKFFATVLFLLLGIMMITSHLTLPVGFAADEGGDSGGDSGGGGGDSGSGDSGGDSKDSGDSGGGSEDNNQESDNGGGSEESNSQQEDKQEVKDEPKEENMGSQNTGSQVQGDEDEVPLASSQDKPIEKIITPLNTPIEPTDIIPPVTDTTPKIIDKNVSPKHIKNIIKTPIDKIKSTPPTQEEIEKEKAAIEDYIYDEPGKVKPYSIEGVKEPWKIKLIESLNAEAEQKKPQGQQYNPEDDPYEVCDVSDKCRGPGVKVNENGEGSITNCIGYYCFGEEEKEEYEKIIKSGKCDGVNDSPKDKDDCMNNGGRGGEESPWHGCDKNDKSNHNNNCRVERHYPKYNWCHWHDCKKHHHDHHHDHNHDHHNYDSKNYYYYYTNDYSNNHATVILQPDYSHSNNYHDIRVVIGDDQAFDTIINFAGKPENLVVTGLDLDEKETFDTCMENLHSDEVNCVTATLKDENKAVYVDIRIP